jgi:hypothetical protein
MAIALAKRMAGPTPETSELIDLRRSITRVGGWTISIGALIWIFLWTFAPRGTAPWGSLTAIGVAANEHGCLFLLARSKTKTLIRSVGRALTVAIATRQ